MRAFVTGATGFIGGRVVHKLRDRGDEVVALVRTPSKAQHLAELGCSTVEGDVGSVAVMADAMRGCNAIFHLAAIYEVGVTRDRCDQMHEANVQGTANVLDAASSAEVQRIVYVSTVGYFGNTRGDIVDEDYQRTDLEWLSCYDETKHLAHELVKQRIAQGAPIVIAMPGGVYGPGDHSDLATLIKLTKRGLMKVDMMSNVGFTFAHVDDIATGIIAAHDRGRIGEAYVLGGEITTLGELVARIARLAGKKPPRFAAGSGVVRTMKPMWPLISRVMGMGPNLDELIKAADEVTYWARHDKAARELGYSPRPLDVGLAETVAAF